MKKLSIFLASLVAIAGLASCSEDREPVYQNPTENSSIRENFKVYAPQFQNLLVNIDDATEDTFSIVLNGQPDYGFSGITNYSILVSLTEDFKNYVELKSNGTGTLSSMEFGLKAFGSALCQLKGWEKPGDFKDEAPMKVYVRGVAMLKGDKIKEITIDHEDGSQSKEKAKDENGFYISEWGSYVVTSNYVTFNAVKLLEYIKLEPAVVYFVGKAQGWVEPKESNKAICDQWVVSEPEDAVGCGIYYGTFKIAAGEAMFRFYTKLTGWEDDSWGYKVDDEATDVEEEVNNNLFQYEMVHGKGAFDFPNWPGGTMDIVIDWTDEEKPLLTITLHPDE